MTTILLINTALAWEVQTTEAGEAYHWANMPLDYVWTDAEAPNLGELASAIHESFDVWADVPDAFIDVYARDTTATPEVSLDDAHVVFFEHDWPIDDIALAVATTWADEQGNILSFDIRINGTVPWSTVGDSDAYDLQAAVTHEVGHVLGLEHSAVVDANMYATHGLGDDWRRDLHDDDAAAVQFVYGDGPTDTDDEGPPLPFGCNVVPAWTPRTPSPAWILGLPLYLMIRRPRGR
ncbi:MAG: matrixin family metalloprotease [Myxococcales bacterium]|nr:matrixin family metalloprotease [Myxococcales bacterium]